MIITNPPIRMSPLERKRSCGNERNITYQTKIGVTNAASTSPHRYSNQLISTTFTSQGNRAKQPQKCTSHHGNQHVSIPPKVLSQSLGDRSFLFPDRFASASTTNNMHRYENNDICFSYKPLEFLTSMSFS
jgi:hypothetical protein